WAALADLCDTGSKTDGDQAARLRTALAATDPAESMTAYRDVFLKKDGDPRGRLITRAISEGEPALAARLEAERDRVHALCDKLKAARILSASAALFRVADRVLDRYEALKGARGHL